MANLLDLPNCVMIYFLTYLDATSLYSLSRTCKQFHNLIKQCKILWKYIDGRRSPNDQTKIDFITSSMHEETRHILLSGDKPNLIITQDLFFEKINDFKYLSVLALENQSIIGTRYSMLHFPTWLHELSLRRTQITNEKEFFRNSSEHMKHLRVLILDECHWLETSAFMSISKYENLEILSVYKCNKMENSIPYLSLAVNYGFRNLKIFDARLTCLGNTLLRSINNSKTILAFYLQNFDVSYKIDYYKRKIAIMQGSKPLNQHNFYDWEFDPFEPGTNELNSEDISEHYNSLDDCGLIDYLSRLADNTNIPLPKSVLYIDPYNKCQCGYNQNETKLESDILKNGSFEDTKNDSNDEFSIPKMYRSWYNSCKNKIDLHTSQIKEAKPNRDRLDVRELNNHQKMLRDSPEIIWTLDPTSRSPTVITHVLRHPNANPDEPENQQQRKRNLEEDQDGPEVKKAKTAEENIPGPSGLNREQEIERNVVVEEESDSENEQDVIIPIIGQPIVRIINMDQVPKDCKVPLKRLSLRGYKKITNNTLRYINNLNLELLDLTYTNCTVDGINNYLVDHPTCRIIHERFCVCPINLHF